MSAAVLFLVVPEVFLVLDPAHPVAVGQVPVDGLADAILEGDLGLPGVTFRVNQWFSGGEARTFRVDLQVPEDSFDIGSRLLVSGESRWGEADLADAIAWGCGFTRYHDAKTAREWQQAF